MTALEGQKLRKSRPGRSIDQWQRHQKVVQTVWEQAR